MAGGLGLRGTVVDAVAGALGPSSSQISPPWNSTILRHIARPMPVPVYSSFGCSRWKITKMRSA